MTHSDRRSLTARAYRRLYHTARWRKLRLHHLASHPICVRCEQHGRVTPATVVDHREPHRGDVAMFFDPDNLNSLCDPCHDRAKQREERRGYSTDVNEDGVPADPRHPFNQ